MQTAKDMAPIGKRLNPHIKPKEHEGLKRVVVPDVVSSKRSKRQASKLVDIETSLSLREHNDQTDIESKYFDPMGSKSPPLPWSL